MAAAAERPSVQKRSAWLWAQHLFVRLGVLPFLLIIAVVVFALMSDRFLSVQNLTNVTRQSTYLAMVAMGQMLALLTGGFDLSVGTILALTSVIGAMAMAAGIVAAIRQTARLHAEKRRREDGLRRVQQYRADEGRCPYDSRLEPFLGPVAANRRDEDRRVA